MRVLEWLYLELVVDARASYECRCSIGRADRYLVVFISGIIWALVLEARDASIYQGIGHAAESVVAGLAGRAALNQPGQSPGNDDDGPAENTGVEAYR